MSFQQFSQLILFTFRVVDKAGSTCISMASYIGTSTSVVSLLSKTAKTGPISDDPTPLNGRWQSTDRDAD